MKSALNREAARRLIELPPASKLLIVSAVDLLILMSAAAGCFLPAQGAINASQLVLCLVVPLLTELVLFALGVYRAIVRFVTTEHLLRIVAGAAIGGAIAAFMSDALLQQVIVWERLLLYASGSAILLIVSRGLAARFLRPALGTPQQAARAVIYGAGAAGTQLAAALQTSSRLRPVAFVDVSSELHGRSLLGLPVYAPEALAALKAQNRFDQILLAIPSLHGVRRRELLESLAPLAAKVMVVPSLEDLTSGKHRLDELHEVQVEDLLSRERAEPIQYLLELHLKNKTVMVTGAAGTIGSELCRQAIEHGANKLVMLDHSEFGLYTVQQELRELAFTQGCELVGVLGSVADDDLLVSVMHRNLVDSVYHAAAYKHVSLVEQNVLSSVSNNVFGTLAVVRAAARCGVANVVLVSTDKAVRPSSIMGATKRICELIVQALAVRHPDTSMSIVRFGNVLASSGSVIPLFRKQIQQGGPVTVTHPEVTRYFMTINEAAQLVIQAGAMGSKGDVFVLDMGQPIKIMEVAERMIRLSGLEVRSAELPHGDIPIEIIGLRPGEKLHEELFIGDKPGATSHPRIFKASEKFMPWSELEPRLHAVRTVLASGNSDDLVWTVHQLARENAAPEDLGTSAPVPVPAAGRAGNIRIVRDSIKQ